MAKLTVRPNNPFSTGRIQRFGDNQPVLYRRKVTYTPGEGDVFHTVVQDEDLTKISYQYYNDSKFYWVLADVNDIQNPLDLSEITTLVIPELTRLNFLTPKI